MSYDIEGTDRGLEDVVEDFLAIAQTVRAKYQQRMASAIASDNSTKIDEVMGQMNEEANDLLTTLGEIEGLQVEVEFVFDSEDDLGDDPQIILAVQGSPIEFVPHA